MSDIVESAPPELEMQSLSSDELRRQLNDAIGITETALIRVAAIWRELVRRGEDLSNVKFSLGRFMVPIAEGRLLPSLVVAMSGQTRALERVAELTVTDQQKLVAGDKIHIFRGGSSADEKALSEMTFGEIALAVGEGRIRYLDEQKLSYERSAASKARRAPVRRPRKITVLPGGLLRIGTLEVEVERVLAALRAGGVIE